MKIFLLSFLIAAAVLGACSPADEIAPRPPVYNEMPDVPPLPIPSGFLMPLNPYDGFWNFIPENLTRYESYAAERTELTADEIIWRVNAAVDMPHYSGIITIDVSDSVAAFATGSRSHPTPLLINKTYRLPDNFAPENLVSLPSGRQVTAETYGAFETMRAYAKGLGLTLNDVSAYRSIARQTELYADYVRRETAAGASDPVAVVDEYCARPGHSEHHTGRTIDLAGSSGGIETFDATPEAAWVRDNVHRFGFILRYHADTEDITGYTYEPWHVTFVGKGIAGDMHEKGIKTLEEYTVKHLEHRPPA